MSAILGAVEKAQMYKATLRKIIIWLEREIQGFIET